jgi:2-polyprenyl-3-methyl-5-hydroxy-6-metoxy-1,4-benzoquinol methylase
VKNLIAERPTRDLHGRLAWTRAFVRASDLADKDVLDIGCGYGWFTLVALDHRARSVTGIEPSEEALSTVREHLRSEACVFTVGTAVELPFADNSFDTVCCWEVLEHLPRGTERRAFAEIARVLRPGGVLYLSTPHAAPLPTVLDPAWWLIGHRHYSRARLRAFAEGAGLLVNRLETRGRTWEMIQLLNMSVSKWVFRRPPFFAAALGARVDAEWRRPGFTNIFLEARCRAAT